MPAGLAIGDGLRVADDDAVTERAARGRWLLIACAAFVVDAPMLIVPFVGDDALRANVDGWLAVHHATLIDAFRAELFREDVLVGRFHPAFVALTLFEMHVFHRSFPLEVVQLFAVAANVATVGLVVRELTGSTGRGVVAAACSVLMLQMRVVYDATNGDALHLPLTLEAGLLGVGSLAYAYRTRASYRGLAYGASLAFFALAIAFYELMLPLIVPLVLLSATRSRGSPVVRCFRAFPFLVVAAADVVTLVVIRRTYPPAPGSFYAASLGGSYAHAAAAQLVATLPFAYEIVDPQRIFHASGTYGILAALIAFAVSTAIVARLISPTVGRIAIGRRIETISVTTGLALLASGIVVAASPLYQDAIRSGTPYAPVYFQGFGLVLVVIGTLSYRSSERAGPSRPLLAAYGTSCVVLFVSNAVVANDLSPSGYARTTIVDGLSHGAAADVPAGSLVYLDRSYYWVNDNSGSGPGEAERGPLLWDSTYFYRLWSGRTWRTRKLADERLAVGEEAYEIYSVANDARKGTLVVQKVRGRGNGVPPAIERAIVYERGRAALGSSPPAIASAFTADDFHAVRSGADWRSRAFRPHCPSLPDDALVANAPTAARLIFGDGFYGAEDDGTVRWHWAGPRAELALVNDAARPLVVRFRAFVETVGAARGTVAIRTRTDRQRIDVTSRRRVVTSTMSLAPRSAPRVRFETDAPDVALAGDPRDVRYRIVDPTLTDVIGCGAADAAERRERS